MKALVWHATNDVRVERVPDPKILNPRDAIVKITSTAICGSDLHLLDGYIPTMQAGDILGHEFMGEVVEVGKENSKLKVGDRVVVPFTIACGRCFFCEKQLWSLCDNSNPKAWMAEKVYGFTTSGLFGYSHMTGGYAGGQAEYARVPFADVGPLKVPDSLSDEQVLFLSDIFPTGYMAAENCEIQRGDTVAIWGCGPVGQMAIRSAYLIGAERVIAIDDVPERLRLAEAGGAETLNFDADLTPASMPSASRRTARRSTPTSIARRRRRSSPPIGRTRFVRRSTPAARAASSQSPVSTAASSTRCRSARRSRRG
jgi:threonine dehydrogenase-like Zn-dependent dehydrogenase